MTNPHSLIVITSDAYVDVLPTFVSNFKKFGLDQYFYKILACQTIGFENEFFDEEVLTCRDSSWTFRLNSALKKVNSGRVMVLMEDYILVKCSSVDSFLNYFSYSQNHELNLLRFDSPLKGADVYKRDGQVKFLKKTAPYFISTRFGIWNTDYLTHLTSENLSPWEFEAKCNSEAYRNPNNLTENVALVDSDEILFVDLIHKGKIDYTSVKTMQKYRANISPISGKEHMSVYYKFWYQLKSLLFHIYVRII